MGHGVNQSQHRIDGLVQRRVGTVIDVGSFNQDVQLCDQLDAQYGHLLIKDVPGL